MSRPYVAIDIETTGIDDRSHILQISAVFDDLVTPIDQLPKLDLPIKYKEITYSEPYAIGMNAELFKKMMNKDFVSYTPTEAALRLVEFLQEVQTLCGVDYNGRPNKIIMSGKNVASFDIPKIQKFLTGTYLVAFNNLVHYKTLDVGSLYYDVFQDNVSLSKINELTGRKEVSHNALDDAFDVVYAVRHKLGVK